MAGSDPSHGRRGRSRRRPEDPYRTTVAQPRQTRRTRAGPAAGSARDLRLPSRSAADPRGNPTDDDGPIERLIEADPRGGPPGRRSRSTSPSTRRRGRTRRCRSSSPGSLEAPVCVFGRDLGKDEVAAGRAADRGRGRLVRLGLSRRSGPSRREDRTAARRRLKYALLTNTVPYKPPGNKAYPGVGEGAVPAVRGRIAGRVTGRATASCARDRGVPVVRPLCRAGEVDGLWASEDRRGSAGL